MRLLLDTCSFLWIVSGSSDLSENAGNIFSDPANEAFLSSVSAWEIAIKHGLGKLPLPGYLVKRLVVTSPRSGQSPH